MVFYPFFQQRACFFWHLHTAGIILLSGCFSHSARSGRFVRLRFGNSQKQWDIHRAQQSCGHGDSAQYSVHEHVCGWVGVRWLHCIADGASSERRYQHIFGEQQFCRCSTILRDNPGSSHGGHLQYLNFCSHDYAIHDDQCNCWKRLHQRGDSTDAFCARAQRECHERELWKRPC